MTISSRWHITFLFTFKPTEVLEPPSSVFKDDLVLNFATFIVNNLTLRLIYILMKPHQNVSVIVAFLIVINSSVDEHFVILNQYGDVTFPRSRLVIFVVDRVEFSPELGIDIIFVDVVETLTVTTSSENNDLVKEAYAGM